MSEQRDDRDGGIGGWLAGPAGQRLVMWLGGASAVLILADLVLHKHGPFAIEHVYGFYGWIGLAACLAVAGLARVLQAVLARPEDYYDR